MPGWKLKYRYSKNFEPKFIRRSLFIIPGVRSDINNKKAANAASTNFKFRKVNTLISKSKNLLHCLCGQLFL